MLRELIMRRRGFRATLEDVMLTNEENELLCRVEGDAPMGQIMRRHWLPACLIEEVEEPD